MSPIEAENIAHTVYVIDDAVAVPSVYCGDEHRQLEWLEVIQNGDEYYGGTDERREWLPAKDIGARYRPHIANSFYAPHAIHRRKVA